MLKHVVLFKLKDVSGVDEVVKELNRLKAIELISNVEVKKNAVNAPENYEVMLSFDVKNEADLKAYLVHPLHVEVVKGHAHLVTSKVKIDYNN